MDKPSGPTSHDVVAIARRALGQRRMGHTGTLDPFASGLLVMLVGRATRIARYLDTLSKDYLGTVRLGTTTTTDDSTGEPLRQSDAWQSLSDQDVSAALASFRGDVSQKPPRFSAKVVAGRRAYRRARGGEAFELEPETVRVDRLDLVERRGQDLLIAATVGTGTYIRSLARDIGEALGCGAHLAALRRTRIGPFSVDQAASLDDVKQGRSRTMPAITALPHLPTVELDPATRNDIVHGRPIPAGDVRAGTVVLTSGGDVVAIAETDGVQLRPRVVLAE